ncbi:MAG: M15 family metallopeptidase [Alkalimonas sp.]|nr:M15 family metallopeptidase [Alkalimonas sp.]
MIEPLLSASQLTGQDPSHLIELSDGNQLHPAAAQGWLRLCQLAAQDGIELAIVSSYRSYQRQALIWQQKYQGIRPVLDAQQRPVAMEQLSGWPKLEAILRFSALPGASRHHWGTELDVMDKAALPPGYQLKLTADEYQAGGVFARLGSWLQQHAHKAGFFLPYQHYRGGVAAEPWHISFQPLSEPCLKTFTQQMLRHALEQAPILGQELVLAQLPRIWSGYVQNIGEASA